MMRFRYVARDASDNQVAGELTAYSPEDADRELRDRGLTPLEIRAHDSSPPPLWNREGAVAAEVVDMVARVGGSGTALIAGLRAAAAESADRHTARALRSIATDMEGGQTLDQVLALPSRKIPVHVRGLVLAAARTGRLDTALDELVDQQRLVRDTFSGVWQAVAYPLLVLFLSLILLLALPVLVVPQFKAMFMDFGLRLPVVTELLFTVSDLLLWLGHNAAWGLLGVALLVVGFWFVLPRLAGRGVARRVVYAAPVIGPLWQWAATAEFTQLLALLIEADIPLGEALHLTAGGLRDASFREACTLMSESVERAQPLSTALALAPGVPPSLIPFVRWGEKTGDVVDSLRTAASVFLERVRLRGVLLRSVSPPIVFVLVLAAISLTVISLFLPLISLIQGLS